jgi:hypothetical protein
MKILLYKPGYLTQHKPQGEREKSPAPSLTIPMSTGVTDNNTFEQVSLVED